MIIASIEYFIIAEAYEFPIAPSSSATDQISQRTIAVKKLADPFKTENIARHMYREVKLLKMLKHDNVGVNPRLLSVRRPGLIPQLVDYSVK